jgi:hypothetical protein
LMPYSLEIDTSFLVSERQVSVSNKILIMSLVS